LTVEVEEGGSFEGAFADFSPSKYHFVLNVYLHGKAAQCNWHLAAIAAEDDQKLLKPRFITKKSSLGSHGQLWHLRK
jgi:hypothetical protein